MSTTLIAVNQTAGALALDNIPVPNHEVPASGSVTLTDYATPEECQADQQLEAHVAAGDLLINDGVRTLTQTQSLNALTHVVKFSYRNDGTAFKQPCLAATTTNIANLSTGAPDTVDGVALAQNSRVLVTSQTDPTENGIYEVTSLGTGANGTWIRAADFHLDSEVRSGAKTWVVDGDVYGESAWHLETSDPVTIGTSSLVWHRMLSQLRTLAFIEEYDNGSQSGAYSIDALRGQVQKLTLAGAVTLSFTAPEGPGEFTLRIVQDATGSRTITWPASVKWPGGTPPTLTTAANAIDIVRLYYDGSAFYGQALLNYS